MKVLIIIPTLGSVYGGPSKIAVELAQALGNSQADVDIVTTSANGINSESVLLRSWISKGSYRVQYFPYLGMKKKYTSLFFRMDPSKYEISFSLMKWLFQHVTEYDLVYTISIFSLSILVAQWICQTKGVPYIVNPQGMLEPWALAYKAWKKQIFYNLLTKPSLKHASAIFTSSSSETEHIKSLDLGTPLFTIPNGINRHEFETVSQPEIFYQQFPNTRNKSLIIFLGRIDPKKGLDLLADAFAKVYSLFPTAHLVVAGQDNIGFLPTVKSYFEKKQCLDAVTFTGMLTGSNKHAALAAASVYVAPSYSEGFSMSILEGMASGLPCVFTTGCNFPEAKVVQAAHVVNINAEEIADALIYCLKDPIRAKNMGKCARQYILNEYNWEIIATKMIEMYRDILSKREVIRKQ